MMMMRIWELVVYYNQALASLMGRLPTATPSLQLPLRKEKEKKKKGRGYAPFHELIPSNELRFVRLFGKRKRGRKITYNISKCTVVYKKPSLSEGK